MGVFDFIEGVGSGLPVVGNAINYFNQRENQRYMRGVQDEIFSRSDNAVQRRKADLIAAGLSPTLAAGSAADVGSAINTSPVQGDAGQGIKDVASLAMGAMQMDANIAQTVAQTAVNKAQEQKLKADTKVSNAEAGIKSWDLNKYMESGLPSNASGVSKTVSGLDQWITKKADQYSSDMINKVRSYRHLPPLDIKEIDRRKKSGISIFNK